jgi:amino acid transporter
MWQAFRAVFWSFFGVRKGKHLANDAKALTPGQVILAGLVAALLFVLALLVLVHFVTRQ